MFLHHFICSVHFPTVQKHTGFETIPHLYWKNDKGVKPANGFQPAFSGHSVSSVDLLAERRPACIFLQSGTIITLWVQEKLTSQEKTLSQPLDNIFSRSR